VGGVVLRELVVVEIVERGLVAVADVDHGDGGVGEVGVRGSSRRTTGTALSARRTLQARNSSLCALPGCGEDRGEGRHEERSGRCDRAERRRTQPPRMATPNLTGPSSSARVATVPALGRRGRCGRGRAREMEAVGALVGGGEVGREVLRVSMACAG